MSQLPVNVPAAQPAPSETEIARAVVLLSEGLLTDEQFSSLAGFARQDVSEWLMQPGRIDALHRIEIELTSSGALARIRAAHASDEAIRVAIEIMRDENLSPTPKLDAARTVLRAGGAEKPAERDERPLQNVRININLALPGEPAGTRQITVNGKARVVPPQTGNVIDGEVSES